MYFAAISDPNNDNGGAESERKKKRRRTPLPKAAGWLLVRHTGEKKPAAAERNGLN